MPSPADDAETLAAIRASDGDAVAVEEAEIVEAVRLLGLEGLMIEPSGAVAVAAVATAVAILSWEAGRPIPAFLVRKSVKDHGTSRRIEGWLPEGKEVLVVEDVVTTGGSTREGTLETVMEIPSDGVRIAFLGVGESKVELVEPTDHTTGVARFLAGEIDGTEKDLRSIPLSR